MSCKMIHDRFPKKFAPPGWEALVFRKNCVLLHHLNRHQPLILNNDEKQNGDDANNKVSR
jgi:hypothetical protein